MGGKYSTIAATQWYVHMFCINLEPLVVQSIYIFIAVVTSPKCMRMNHKLIIATQYKYIIGT